LSSDQTPAQIFLPELPNWASWCFFVLVILGPYLLTYYSSFLYIRLAPEQILITKTQALPSIRERGVAALSGFGDVKAGIIFLRGES